MKRVFILLFDSFGIGASQDAANYGDTGADTFGHIALAENPTLPNLTRLGLNAAHLASTGKRLPNLHYNMQADAMVDYAVEQSLGKDTPSGHWEMAGVPVMFEWGYFPPEYPSFPEALVTKFIKQAKIPGLLGNKHASGTVILDELGSEHIKTGKPIVYTSGDSVFQVAAHEEHFGLERLYAICDIARTLVDEYKIGRVIARPFIGVAGNFQRTANRRDLSTPPPAPTLLDQLVAADKRVIAIGKIADIYAHRGISETVKADGNMALFDATLSAAKSATQDSLIFTNFVDFDSKYGHRRDVAGYAKALEALDARLPELENILQKEDLVIITADHGCDPTLPGSDHTREHIPILAFGPNIPAKFIGRRETFADIGQTIAQYFGIEPLDYGVSFLS